MSADAQSSSGFRLATGCVTVLLGPDAARRGLLSRIDPGNARGVLTVTSARQRGRDERLAALAHATEHRPSLVLVDRLTDGLDAADRRAVLAELRTLAAAGLAVLVNDADPVAALAVADTALRAGSDGSLRAENLGETGPTRV